VANAQPRNSGPFVQKIASGTPRPPSGRIFFAGIIPENLDLGRSDMVQVRQSGHQENVRATSVEALQSESDVVFQDLGYAVWYVHSWLCQCAAGP
jgi:hypothetical protein